MSNILVSKFNSSLIQLLFMDGLSVNSLKSHVNFSAHIYIHIYGKDSIVLSLLKWVTGRK